MNRLLNLTKDSDISRLIAGLIIGFSLTLTIGGTLDARTSSPTDQSQLEQLRRKIENNPTRNDWRYELARALEQKTRYAEARKHYRQLVNSYPENPDYRYGLSRVMFYQKNLQAALREIRKARRAAPDYPGVYRHELNVLVALDKLKKAQALAKDARHRFPNKTFKIPKPGPEWKINWISRIDDLSGNREDWQSHGLKLTRIKDRFDVTAGIERVTRFDEYGERTSIRVNAKLNDKFRSFLGYQTAPAVNFLADDHLRGGVSYMVDNGIELRITGEKRDYDDTETIGVQPGVTVYRDRGYFGYTLYHSELDLNTDRDANTHFFFGKYNMRNALSLKGGVSIGETIETTGSNQVKRSDLVNYSISLTRELSRRSSLQLQYEYEDLDQFYIRRGLTLNLFYDF